MLENSPEIQYPWRPKQSRWLVTGEPKAVAIESGLHVNTLYDLINCKRPVGAVTAFRICHAQQDYRFLQDLAEYSHALLLPCPLYQPKRPTILILADLTLSIGQVLELLHKVAEGKPLTDQEQRRLEQSGAEAEAALKAGIEKSRELRREEHTK